MNIIIGIILFLTGVKLLSSALNQKISLQMDNTNPIYLIIYAVIITSLVQSSSIIICLILVFVSSNRISLKNGIYLVMGANIGTTSTALITSFSYSFWVIVLIMLVIFIVTKNIKITFSILCFLYGLNIIKASTGNYTGLLSLILSVKSNLNLSLLTLIFTFIMQSSSLIVVFIQGLYKLNLVSYEQILFVLIGINIGTTSTAIICSLVLKSNAKKLAYFHVLFNIIGSCILLVSYYIFNIRISLISVEYDIFFMHFFFNFITTICVTIFMKLSHK